LAKDGRYQVLILWRHVSDEDSLVWNDTVISICAAKMALVVMVPPTLWHFWVIEKLVHLGRRLL
jgi:hypothetical protein